MQDIAEEVEDAMQRIQSHRSAFSRFSNKDNAAAAPLNLEKAIEEENRRLSTEFVDDGGPPDGGLVAWLQVLGGFLAYINAFGLTQAFGVFQTYYKSTLIPDTSDSAISWVGSIQGFLIISGSILAGRLVDAGYSRIMMIAGTILSSFGFMMLSLSTKYYQILLSQGICFGLGSCCLFIAPITTVNTYFSKRKGLACGIVATGSSLGCIIHPIMINRLIKEIGFPWTCRVVGFMILGAGIIVCLLYKPRLKSRKSGPLIDVASFKDVPYMVFALGSFLVFFGSYVPIFYVQSYAEHINMDPNLSIYMSAMLGAGSLFGRVIPNMVADELGPLNTFAPSLAIASMLCFCWIAIKSTAGYIVFVLIYGFWSGTAVSMPPVCVASITSDLEMMGTRLGMNFFISGLGLLGGEPVAGKLLAVCNGSYVGAQCFAGACVAGGCVLTVISRFMLSKKTGSMKC